MSEPKIRLVDVRKRFGAKTVLDGVTLDVAAGRRTVLIGAAATGKSVLFKCILGLYAIDGGHIEVDGEVVRGHDGAGASAAVMERFGVLFQRSALFDSLTVWENIAFKLINVRGVARARARELAMEKIAQVGLKPDVATLYPADLSGGMQRRVGLARAIAGEPEILLLDDPTAGLDPITTKRINRLIRENVDALGATAFAITGDMKAAREEYDDLAMIHDGRIIWHGPTSAVESADNPYLQQLIHGRAQGPIKMRLRAPEAEVEEAV